MKLQPHTLSPPPSQEHYGKHDDSSVAAIKALFVEMELEAAFKAYEEESYAALTSKIDAVAAAGELPAGVFSGLLAKIYKREK